MPNTSDQTTPNTIVLIHGLWLTPLSWEHWIDRYSSRGYKVVAPTWPGMEAGSRTCVRTRIRSRVSG